MFKTETHLHTAEVSVCGKIAAEELVRRYRDAGYHTVFVTDHFQDNTLNSYGDIPWKEKVKLFFKGYELAKEAGENCGVVVLPSAEVRLHTVPNHYLVYGIDAAFFEKREDILDLSIEDFSAYAKENGACIVQAHPFRDGANSPTPNFVDAIEVYNLNCRHENNTEKAYSLAVENRLPMTAGSDTHREEDIAASGIMTETPIESAEDYIRLLRANAVTPIVAE